MAAAGNEEAFTLCTQQPVQYVRAEHFGPQHRQELIGRVVDGEAFVVDPREMDDAVKWSAPLRLVLVHDACQTELVTNIDRRVGDLAAKLLQSADYFLAPAVESAAAYQQQVRVEALEKTLGNALTNPADAASDQVRPATLE